MKKIFLILLIVCLAFTLNIKAQNQNTERFTIGSSITYIWEKDKLNYIDHDEITWNLNAAMRISKRFHFGVQALSIFSKSMSEFDYYHLIGSFVQYEMVQMDAINLFLETSINRGDYLLANDELYPLREKNLFYFGWGGGMELPLFKSKNLYLDLSFISYMNITYPQKTFAFTQYIIGVNYKFGKD